MTHAVNTRLGPYEILGALGAGGMGEVYRARDSRLGRDVAIKVLPSGLASDPERLKRFEREARSASSLNHPNIVTIYDIGSENGVSFIAMELVKGKPLRSELFAPGMPIRRLLQLGAQMAEGLARAHAAGIVHRDLKPENVMVTEDDHVKILDFGLAKLTQPDSSGGTTIAPTMTGATQEGVIVGTVGYMSPEQAAGLPVDYRSDQFSLGSILYEMATGRRAFLRASPPQTLTAIIQDEPEPIGGTNRNVPAPVRWIVERCLAKQPRNRYASTEDLARDLATVRDRLSETTSAASLPVEAPAMSRKRRWLPSAVGLAIAIAAGIAVWQLAKRESVWNNPFAGARFSRLTDWNSQILDAAISADGKFVAILAERGGSQDVWVSQIGGGEFANVSKGEIVPIASRAVRAAGFSDDGAHVWWSRLTKDQKRQDAWMVPTMGGVPRPFLDEAMELVWSPDRARLLYHSGAPGDPIFIADRSGANPRQVFIGGPGIHNHFPAWSPDGRFIYFVSGIPPDEMDIWRIDAAGGAAERLTHHNTELTHLVILDDRTALYTATREDGGSGLYALDLTKRTSHPVSFGLEEYLSVAASADGRRLVATVGSPNRSLWTVPITDHVVEEAGTRRFELPTMHAIGPRFGPDYILYLSPKGGALGIWRHATGADIELWKGTDGVVREAPAISPDGTMICFGVRREGRTRLYLMRSDGSGAHPLADGLDVSGAPGAPSWSPDTKWVAVAATEGKAHPLYKVPVDGGAPVRLVAGQEAVISNPVWSPDGSLILYSEGKGFAWVKLRAVSQDGSAVSVPDLEILYRGDRYRFMPDGRSLVVSVGGPMGGNFWLLELATGRRRQLTDLKAGYDSKSFDVSPDGKTILFDRFIESSDVALIDLPPR